MWSEIARNAAEYGPSSPDAVVSRDLSPAALDVLRGVAGAARQGPGSDAGASDDSTRAAAQVIAGDARGRSVTAEHMIIAVKREWSALPEVRDVGRRIEARALLDRLLTHCIDAFYRRR